MKYVSKGPIDSKSSLVQIMAWRQTEDKPLTDPMMTQVGYWRISVLNELAFQSKNFTYPVILIV